MLGRTT